MTSTPVSSGEDESPVLRILLNNLNTAYPEGIPISENFTCACEKLSASTVDLNIAWEALHKREDILLVDGGQELSRSPLTKLSYEEIVSLGLGEKIIRLRAPIWPVTVEGWAMVWSGAGFVARQSSTPSPSTPEDHNQPETQAQNSNELRPRESSSTIDYSLNSVSNAQSHASEPHISSSAANPAEAVIMDLHANTFKSQPGQENVASESPRKRRGRPPKVRNNLAQNPSSKLANATSRERTQSSGNKFARPPIQGTQLENASSIAAQGSHNTGTAVTEEVDPTLEPSSTLPQTPRRRTRLNSQSQTPSSKITLRPNPSRGSVSIGSILGGDDRPIRQASFISHDELEYQQGVCRAYVGLPGTENTGNLLSKTGHDLVVVFKLTALKDPDCLSKGKGSWAPYLAELMQKDVEHVQKNTKRPRRTPGGRAYTKRQKKDASTDIAPPLIELSPQPPPSFLPDPQTGAWNIPSIPYVQEPLPRPGKETEIATALHTPPPPLPPPGISQQKKQVSSRSTSIPPKQANSPYSGPIFGGSPLSSIEAQQNDSRNPVAGSSFLGGMGPNYHHSRNSGARPQGSTSVSPAPRSDVPAWPPSALNQWQWAKKTSPSSSAHYLETKTQPTAPAISASPALLDGAQSQKRNQISKFPSGTDTNLNLDPRSESSVLQSRFTTLASQITSLGRTTSSYSSPYTGSYASPYSMSRNPMAAASSPRTATSQTDFPNPSPQQTTTYSQSQMGTVPANKSTSQGFQNTSMALKINGLSQEYVTPSLVPHPTSQYLPAPSNFPQQRNEMSGIRPAPQLLQSSLGDSIPAVHSEDTHPTSAIQTTLSSRMVQFDPLFENRREEITARPAVPDVLAARTTDTVTNYTVANGNAMHPAKSRKRKLSTTAKDSQSSGPAQPKAQKLRQSQTPSQMELAKLPNKENVEELTVEEEFQELLRLAEQTKIPEDQARLPCLFTKYTGNLILSADYSTLEFFWIAQRPPQVPIFSLPVSKIVENPITSVRGSKPMQLRIKAESENSEHITSHSFVYGDSATCAEAASNMRMKIIVAMGAEKLRAGEGYVRPSKVKEAIVKPYHCKLCDARFRNPNGLEYHQTKSNTTCNPNFDPSTKPARKGGRPPKNSGQPRTPQKPRATKRVEVDEDESDSNSSGSSSDGSEDSILEWARKTAGVTDESKEPVPKAKRPKFYKAFNRESEVLEEILVAISQETQEQDDSQAPGPPAPFPSTLPSLAGLCSEMSSGEELNEAVCKEMVMILMRANNDVFPGKRSLWMACVALWLKKYPKTQVLPKSSLCNKSIDDLVDEKILELKDFTFMTSESKLITSALVYVRGIALVRQRSEMLQSLVQESHPIIYVPSHLAPPQSVLDALQALALRQLPNRLIHRGSGNNDDQEDGDDVIGLERGSPDSYDDDDFSAADQYSEEDSVMDEESDSEFGSAAEMKALLGTKRARKRRPRSNLPPGKRYRSPATNARISQSLKNRWQQIKADKVTGPDCSRKSHPGKSRNPAALQTLSQTWHAAPSFLQDPETRSWSVKTGRRVFPKLETGSKYEFRTHLPEPITFMQAMDGSWSVRPFGHGVKPIFSRPASRRDPNIAPYTNIKQRHRPIVSPMKIRHDSTTPPTPTIDQVTNDLLGDSSTKRRRPRRSRPSETPPDVFDECDSDFEVSIDDSIVKSTIPQNRRYTRRASYLEDPGEDVDSAGDTDITFPALKRLKDDAPLNLGLETIPTRFGLPPAIYKGPDIDSLDFPKKYFSVIFTEQKVLGEDIEDDRECSWTIGRQQLPGTQYEAQWDDSVAFTSTTLPYLDLESEEEEDQSVIKRTQRKTIRPRKKQALPQAKSRQGVTWKPRDGPTSMQEKIRWTRSQVALSTDFNGLRVPAKEIADKFKIEVADPNEATGKRPRNGAPSMSEGEEGRFVIAVIVQRILTGGLDLYIDWVLVSTIFQNYSMNYLAAYWKRISEGKEALIEKLGRAFQAAYPAAYRAGKAPSFDWNNLVGNDWNGLIDWAQKNVLSGSDKTGSWTLSTKEDLEDRFDLEDIEVDVDWRESFFSLAMAKHKRVEMAASEPNAVPIAEQIPKPEDDEDVLLVRSYVRATALTPEEDWPEAKEVAKERILSFHNDFVKEAIDSLIASKVIMHRNKGRAVPGRGYEGTDAFFANLRRHMKGPQFVEAVAYKRWMDEQFRSGAESLKLDYMANEGTVMVLSSLQASGRIRIESLNVPKLKFGLIEEGYETKSIPREKITFDMSIKPTTSYIFDDDNERLQRAVEAEPPFDSEGGKLPAWYGISDILIPEVWKSVIMGVAQTVAFRPGVDIEILTKSFKNSLGKWEVKLLMEWGVQVGLFQRISERVEGWKVTEWWWAMVGGVCTM